ncbi:MAG TPA: 2-C-methyl-D-erythritol 2,4-cyclodiphosphate synthase [Gemmatimonadota bacterium]|nr:2-C-methyl-D-erythritol 2,4-cyclodiphosphate synthase [Gemmatimonadota bacterium]
MGLNVRTGIGFDVHRFAEDRPLVLGGVRLDYPRGLAGHSDADALLHAIADALLGAASLGDIGRHFPPDDPAYENVASAELVRAVAGRVRAAGWEIANVDATVLAETPRIAPHVADMVHAIASVLEIDPDRVSVKATTMEGLGPIGREEGIAALAVATLARAEKGRGAER